MAKNQKLLLTPKSKVLMNNFKTEPLRLLTEETLSVPKKK